MLRLMLCVVVAAVFMPSLAVAQNEIPVTYQGRLTDGGGAADGLYDFWVRLGDTELDDGSGTILYEEYILNVEVVDGLFALGLNYPRDGVADAPRWLELNVRPAGSGLYEELSPRQRITVVPEAGNTEAARLQPDNRVLIGNGSDWGNAVAYNVTGAPDGAIQQASVVQTFKAGATGKPTGISGHFNERPVGDVMIFAEILDATGFGLIASGMAGPTSADVNFINFDFVDPSSDGILRCDEMYRIRISYELVSTGEPAEKAATGFTANDPYPDGQFTTMPSLDLTAGVVIDRGRSQVTVFDNGLAFLNGGLIVGPDDGGDAAVVLPKNSVNPAEMLGVPGIVVGESPMPGDPVGTVLVARVMPPTDGFVHATGTGIVSVSGGGGGNAGLTLDSSILGSNPIQSIFSANLGFDDSASVPITIQRVFEVRAGQQVDIYLGGVNSANIQSLVAKFYPVSYRASTPVGQ